MLEKIKVLPKSVLIGFGAVILSTLGIQASDQIAGISGNLSGLLIESQAGCPAHTVPILFGTHSICMDIYEASPAQSCPRLETAGEIDTQVNVSSGDCKAVSVPDALPWSFVTFTQAQQLCARAGKRLPTNDEWYKVALGQGDPSTCFRENSGALLPTGANNCVTNTGVHDIVGNVWEWMNDTVTEGWYENRQLPTSGYVTLVDGSGVAVTTSDVGDSNFGNDYAWVSQTGVQGIIRGGFYGSGTDGGIFSQNVAVPLNFSAVGVGFRCVLDVL